MFDLVTKAVFGIVVFIFVFIVLACFSTFIGAVLGWLVGLVFGDTILKVAALIGIKGISMWEFGAFLGFVGSFFRTVNNTKA